MKKTITSAGLLVLGAASLNAQTRIYAPAPGLTTTELSKPWTVAASVRGFYDDNIFNAHRNKDEAFGFELSPSVAFNWTLPQTYFGLSYKYGYRWYEGRPGRNYDQVHQADVKLSHAFTQRYKLDLSDSFVSAQEPEILTSRAGLISVPLRSEGDNIRNSAAATFTADFTDRFGATFGYTNDYYDYDQRGIGSYSALLDRMEHLGTLNLRWQVLPTTVGILGYQYGVTDYTSKEFLSPIATFRGTDRDNNSHYAYVGVDHSFNPQLRASVRVGAQFTEYDQFSEDTTSPYADASLTYQYAEGSNVLLGVRHQRNATDIAFVANNIPTLDQETTAVYASLNHRITPKLTGSLLGQIQFGGFESGAADSQDEIFLLSGANLTYEINKFLAAEAGYNFDRLDSDINNRSYSRHRIYIGVRASY